MNVAIIVAGGSGERTGLDGGKQLAIVAGRPVLSHTLAAFEACPAVDAIVVVAHPDRVDEYRRDAIDPVCGRKVVAVVAGGTTRQQSVEAGLNAVPEEAGVIVVHDGARPLITPELISDAVRALEEDGALDGVVVGHPCYDTLKTVDALGRVTGTPERSGFWAAQTPQVFRAAALRGAYSAAREGGHVASDDSALVERAGGSVAMLLGPRDNIKITVPGDVLVAERLLEARARGERDE